MTIPVDGQELDKLIDKSTDVLYEKVVERIRRWIIEGHLREGDALPSERELADILGVSRMPVREAFKVLKFLGVVQNIRGKGYVVQKINVKHVLNNIDFLLVDPVGGLHDLFEVREGIESQAARLAAERRTQEDLEAMEDAVWEMEKAIRKGREIESTSMRFHSAVFMAAHNNVMVRIREFLADLLSYSMRTSFMNSKTGNKSLASHQKILQKIREQDADGASSAMKEHLREAALALSDVNRIK